MRSKARSLLQWVLFIEIFFSPIYGLRGSASQLLTVPPPNFEASPPNTQAEIPPVPPSSIPEASKEHKSPITRKGEPIGGLLQEAPVSNAPSMLLPAPGSVASPASITSPVNHEQNGIPVAAPPKELPDHVYPVNHSKGFSPAMIPTPPEVKNTSNTPKGSPVSPSHQLDSSPMMSPVPHEGKQPLNITDAPLSSNPGFSGSSPATSPVPHNKQPPSSAHAPRDSHLQRSGSPPVIDPIPHEGNKTSNITHSPAPSSLHPLESPPGTSPTPHEVKEPSNITHLPPSHPLPSGSSPVTSPAPPQVKEPSNITDSPLPSHPLPSESPPMTSPTPPQVKEPSNATHSPPPSESSPMTSPTPPQVEEPPNATHSPFPPYSPPSKLSPAPAPPNEGKGPSNITHAPSASHPNPSGLSRAMSPTPYEVKEPPNVTVSPLPYPMTSPPPHELKDPSNVTHSPFPSPPHLSEHWPAVSPAPHGVKRQSSATTTPMASPPHPSLSSPLLSPMPHEVKNSSNVTHSLPPESSPMTSPTPPKVKEPRNATHSPLPSESSPVTNPTPPQVKEPTNATHSPLTSPPHPSESSPVTSPTPPEVKQPPNTAHSALSSHPLPSESSPVISPAPHEVLDPSNNTHAPFASNPKPSGSSPATSPTPHGVEEPSNVTHSPLPSDPLPLVSSPVISPAPPEVKDPPSITYPPLASDPKHSAMPPMISPTAHEVKDPSNTTHSPLPLYSPPSWSSPAMSPTPHEVKEPPNVTVSPLPSPMTSPPPHELKDPSNVTHSPFSSPPHSSEHSPAVSPVTHGVRHQSRAANAPIASSPHPSLSSPLLSPMPREAKNTSNVTHAPLPSPPHPSEEIQTPAFAPLAPPPTSSRHAGSMISPVPSHIPAVSPSNEGRKHTPSLHTQGPSSSPVQAPSHVVPKNNQRNHAPSLSPIQAPFPSANRELAHSPSPSSVIPSHHNKWPIHPPVLSPGFSRKPRAPPPKPVWVFPPPPPNLDCKSLSCQEPHAYPPPGSVCTCVLPINVGLRLSVSLYTFFPLISELAQEIASGIFAKQSQVHIMGANSTTDDAEKTSVFIDLVPFGRSFDMNTALLIFERFWHKQVLIKASYFGDYDVLYVRYPGLPPSPPMAPGDVNVDGGENARTMKPLGVDIGKRKEKLSSGLIAVVVLASVIALVISIGAAWLLLLKCRNRSSQPPPTQQATPPSGKPSGTGPSNLGSGPSSTSVSFTSSIAAGSAKTFSLADMERATDRFHESKVIGEGGFGRVYRGTLEDGTMVAVKVLKRHDHQGGREFLAEVEMLSRLHHRNLVKLIGICTEENVRCLVYELIPNGSVESHLHGLDKETSPLDWNARIKIALGAARGLAYLHEDSSPRVIHRDFKSSNILLEHDFTPKVSDFGLARTALGEGNEHISTRVMGTFGYVAPEYAMTGHLLVKSDVYSYGVVLLELLTGRKPVDMSQPPGQENLVSWARPLLTSMVGLEKLIDPALGASITLDSVAKVAAIASMCVQPEVSHRPFMGEVVQALKLVCNESEEHRRSWRQDGSSAKDSDIRISTGLEDERVLSESDLFCTSAAFAKDASGSFRRYSSSGPLTTDRSQKFWEKVRGFSSGSMMEHGIAHRPRSGLDG